MARLKCGAADGWPNAPTRRAPFSRWWESAATTASDISSACQHPISASVRQKSPPPASTLCILAGSVFSLLHTGMKLMLNPQKNRIGERCKCKQHYSNRNHLLGLHQLHGVDYQKT